ncbi:hypothetical protein SAMN05192549_1361 [Duganella sacchari]|jgi:hypothetical protein|uniref:Uncharacterized protein n=3 Tax=Duganella sacchari TaxID=551987 RepID=A0A1M7RFK9_9BURK|nr:hypothetical protein [Duganella sacchari]SHN45030.1 hypothetical protein SAMN05192549_1361 [Duganella sacchari]
MANTEREALWQERVERWRASGLSQRAFALQEGYPIRQVGYWVRRLSAVPSMAALVPVTVQGAAAAAPAMKLCGPQGWSVELPPDTSAAWLADLLQRL